MTVSKDLIGRVHSIQSMGTLDGPGVRFVVFMQGCNLRCGCCHNPDTWISDGGKEYTAQDLVSRASRYKEYFGKDGGITVSGGEPLLQTDFVCELFRLCHDAGINTCLDTSGSVLNGYVDRLLDVTDRVLLDIKYTDDESYKKYVGCSIDKPLSFLKRLDEKGIPTTIRQVIIPTLNDENHSVLVLRDLARAHRCVDKIELLPFKKICQVKYDSMGIEFPFASISVPTKETMNNLQELLDEYV